MNKQIKKKWLKALRSGEYVQCEGQLCSPPMKDNPEYSDSGPWRDREIPNPEGDFGFCCLGVLQNLYHLEKGTEFSEDKWYDGGLDKAVEKWADLPSLVPDPDNVHCKTDNPIVDHLIAMNDGGNSLIAKKKIKKRSFKQIANWIENHV